MPLVPWDGTRQLDRARPQDLRNRKGGREIARKSPEREADPLARLGIGGGSAHNFIRDQRSWRRPPAERCSRNAVGPLSPAPPFEVGKDSPLGWTHCRLPRPEPVRSRPPGFLKEREDLDGLADPEGRGDRHRPLPDLGSDEDYPGCGGEASSGEERERSGKSSDKTGLTPVSAGCGSNPQAPFPSLAARNPGETSETIGPD